MRKLFTVFLLCLTVFTTGCSQKPVENHETVTVWHWMSDREEAFQELARRYEAKTGIPVKFELYAPSEAYTQKVKAAAQTRTLPDIFGVLGESRVLASFVKSGYVARVDEAISKQNPELFSQQLFEKAISVNRFTEGNEYGVTPGVYGVPLDTTTIQMVYNKTLFEKAGLDPENPPTVWEEFIDAAHALQKAEIPVFVSGFGEIWLIDALASNFAMNLMGEDKVFQTYAGQVPYTDPDWVRVLAAFKQLADEEVIIKGAVTMVNKTAEQTFANERAAIAFNGSWCVNVYAGMNPDLKYGAVLPPRLGVLNPMKVWGGAGSSLMVNARSQRKDAAIEFLRWMSEKDQQSYLANATNNLPANRESLGQVNPILAQFADDIPNTTHPNVYPVHEAPLVTEAWCKGIQSILIGEKTPEQVAAEVQSVKEKEMAKKR